MYTHTRTHARTQRPKNYNLGDALEPDVYLQVDTRARVRVCVRACVYVCVCCCVRVDVPVCTLSRTCAWLQGLPHTYTHWYTNIRTHTHTQTSITWEVKAADLSLSFTHKGGLGSSRIPSGRGIGLRFPRFMRERDDKPADHATTASQVIDLYFEQQSVEDEGNAGGGAAAEEEDDEYL